LGTPRLALVGAFVMGGLLLFAVGLFMIGDRRLLFSEQFEIEADFGNVAGVEIGTGVRLSGLPAGEVIGIEIPKAPGGRFVVRMRVREELRALVRTDSEAAILSDGLLGSAFIQLRAGSEVAPLIADGGELRGVDVVAIADLIAEARETFRVAAEEIVSVHAQVSETVDAVGETVGSTTRFIHAVGNDVRRVTAASVGLVDETRRMIGGMRVVLDNLGEGHAAIEPVLQEIEATMQAVQASADRVAGAVERFSGPGSVTDRLVTDAGQVMRHTRDVMADVADNTEALKRNWLFSGFFAERGFFNLDELSVDEYRTLLRDDRYTPLRIWLKAELLFNEVGEDGTLTLRRDAGSRIQEAMSELLKYPRNSPLIVEGYAIGNQSGHLMNDARRRAELVRDYIAREFRRSLGTTGTMTLGTGAEEAEESPSGDGQWDGVALTLFADADEMGRTTPQQ